MEDTRILDLYWQRSESAIGETDKKYGRYCRYIAHSILRDEGEAEETVDDTYVKVWNSIPPKRPDPLKPYLGTVCRRLSLNRYDARKAQKRDGGAGVALDELEECIPDGSADAVCDGIALRDALNRFIGSLPEKAQKVFVRRYWYASSISEIAREYGMRQGSVTVLLLRTRRKLKEFLAKEDFTL